MRVYEDFTVTINPVLQVEKHGIPKPEELLTALAGRQKFTKFNLS